MGAENGVAVAGLNHWNRENITHRAVKLQALAVQIEPGFP
jgi:hypothetical protein